MAIAIALPQAIEWPYNGRHSTATLNKTILGLSFYMYIWGSFYVIVLQLFTSLIILTLIILIMYGLSQCQTSKLQRVQNAADRIALDLSEFCHKTLALQQLHWLPVVKRIQFKMLLLTFKAIHGLDCSLHQWTYNCQTQIYLQSALKQQYSAATSYDENAA